MRGGDKQGTKVRYTGSLESRYKLLRTGNPEKLHYAVAIWLENASEIEGMLKEALVLYKALGGADWFDVSLETAMAALIELVPNFLNIQERSESFPSTIKSPVRQASPPPKYDEIKDVFIKFLLDCYDRRPEDYPSEEEETGNSPSLRGVYCFDYLGIRQDFFKSQRYREWLGISLLGNATLASQAFLETLLLWIERFLRGVWEAPRPRHLSLQSKPALARQSVF
jgi:hypothetical protein